MTVITIALTIIQELKSNHQEMPLLDYTTQYQLIVMFEIILI